MFSHPAVVAKIKNRKMPSKKYPDGWREISNIGRVILGTKFIAFKVPLTSSSWNLRYVFINYFDFCDWKS